MHPTAPTTMEHSPVDEPAPSLRGLYRVGGLAALLAALLFRRNWGAEYSLLRSFGIIGLGPTTAPETAGEWFALLESHRFVGLILLNLFDLVNYALVGLMLIALYAALRRSSPGAAAMGLGSGLVGVAVYLSSNQALGMLSLSERYAAAGTEAERSVVLSAGEALLAIDNPATALGGTGSYISLLLVTVASIIVAAAMLRSGLFSRATAYVGLVAEGAQLSFFIVLAAAPALIGLPPSIAGLFRLIWYVMVGWRLLRLGNLGRQARPT